MAQVTDTWRLHPWATALRVNALVLLAVGITLLLVLIPIVQLFVSSFRSGSLERPGDWTLDNFLRAYSSPLFYETLANTVLLATIGTGLSLVIAVTFAWLTERTDMPYRNVAWALAMIPIGIPSVLFAMSWALLGGPANGALNLLIRPVLELVGLSVTRGPIDIFTLGGLIWLDGLRGVPTIFLMLAAAFRAMDPALEEAGRTAGAASVSVLSRITLPLLAPAIAVAATYSFVSSMEAFEAALVVGLPSRIYVLSTLVYFSAQLRSPVDYGLASAYAATYVVFMLAMVYWYRRLSAQTERFATITGKGYQPRATRLGAWRYPAFGLFLFYLFLTTLAPTFILVWASLLPVYRPPSVEVLTTFASLKNYQVVLQEAQTLRSLVNTVVVTAATATGTMTLALACAWVIVRTRSRLRGLLDALTFLPHAVPGILVALALVLLFAPPPLNVIPIYGTIWVIVLGLMIAFLAFATRLMNGAVIQVHRELEDAAQVSGAGQAATLLRVTLPLVFPAFVSGWLWVAAYAARSFAAPLVLRTRENEMFAVRLYRFWHEGEPGPATAAGVLFLLAIVVMGLLGRLLIVRFSPQRTS